MDNVEVEVETMNFLLMVKHRRARIKPNRTKVEEDLQRERKIRTQVNSSALHITSMVTMLKNASTRRNIKGRHQ